MLNLQKMSISVSVSPPISKGMKGLVQASHLLGKVSESFQKVYAVGGTQLPKKS